MPERYTFAVTADWDGTWWVIGVAGLPPEYAAFTQAASEEEIEPTARECVALLLNVPEDSFDLTIDKSAKEN